MANISIKLNKDGNPIFYSDIRINGNRIRKSLDTNRKIAELKLKKFEQELSFQRLKKHEHL